MSTSRFEVTDALTRGAASGLNPVRLERQPSSRKPRVSEISRASSGTAETPSACHRRASALAHEVVTRSSSGSIENGAIYVSPAPV